MEQVWAFLHLCSQWIMMVWQWLMQLPWQAWGIAFSRMTPPEWVGFLAGLAAISAFVIGIPRLRSFHYTQRYRVFVELYKLNEQLMSRLRSNDVAAAKTCREALRDNIHANSYEFSTRDNTYIYQQWQKANAQANKLMNAMDEKNVRFGDLSDIAELIELRSRLLGEIKKLRKAPMSMNE